MPLPIARAAVAAALVLALASRAPVAFTEYTAWADGENLIIGNIQTNYFGPARAGMPLNRGGTVDFTCATQTVPAIAWSGLAVTPGQSPPGDPP